MKTLALETSTFSATIATLEGPRVRQETRLSEGIRSAQGLAPATTQLLEQTGWSPSQLELIAVTSGPGSFTGLRVGVVTAKTLAYALGCKVRAINTLAVIAHQVTQAEQPVWALLDAQRQELFAARFGPERDARRVELVGTSILTREAWRKEVSREDIVTGPGVASLDPELLDGVQVAPQEVHLPAAVTVGRLAYADAQHGIFDDHWSLQPFYRRRSAAEEKADAG